MRPIFAKWSALGIKGWSFNEVYGAIDMPWAKLVGQILAVIALHGTSGGRSPSLVFGAESLEAIPGTFVPALMLKRQLSGLL